MVQFSLESIIVITYSIGWWIALFGLSYLQHYGTWYGKDGLSTQKWTDNKVLIATYFWPICIPLYSKEIYKATKTIIFAKRRKRAL